MNQETSLEEISPEEISPGVEHLRKITSPGFIFEASIMMPLAILLDLAGLPLFILSFFAIGIPLSFALDIAGIITIGLWMFFRKGRVTISRGTTKRIKKFGKKGATRRIKVKALRKMGKTGRKIFKRLGPAVLGELIPFFGDITPCWTLAVYFELKNN